MPLQTRFRLGPYEIQSAIGAGGMGEVYRAVDTRLDRSVAIKILPASLAADRQFRERLDREARAISKLAHPHICTLYDVGHQEGVDFLVLEYLEGESLAARLDKGPLPLNESLRTAIEVAGALDHAHRAGFVHRDLKPANIFLTSAGAKLLDFGLAKKRDALVTGEGATALGLTQTNLTGYGTIVGTVQYMAPEQVEARDADARSDIFAFGCVLYEMVTGRKAFEGPSPASVIAAILERQPPPISTGRQPVSSRLEHIVSRCLAKKPDERWQTARDLQEELRWVQDHPDEGGYVQREWPARGPLVWGLLAAALVATAALGLLGLRAGRAPRSESAVMRFDIATPPTRDPLSFALSPNGRHLAFVATAAGVSQLWIRPLDEPDAKPLAGTAGAAFPFWSPDGRSLGFFADAKLKRIEIAGGSPQTLAEAAVGRGGTWNTDNVILFAPNSNEIFRVPATGGTPTAVTQVARPEQANHRFPSFLPDGRSFLFYVQGDQAGRGVYLGALDKAETRRLLDVNEAAVVAADGRMLFVRDDTLFAQTLDPARGVLVGDPERVAEHITPMTDGVHTPAISAAAAGMLAYRTGAVERRLIWFDRAGKQLDTVVASDRGVPSNPELAPDGRWLAVDRIVNGNRDIWLVETAGGPPRRFSFDPAVDYDAVWSPDQARIVFASNRTGVTDLYQKASSGAGSEEPLLVSALHKRPLSFSPDGHYLLYRESSSKTQWDLLVLPLGGGGTPFPVVQSPFEDREGQFSPDGNWLAYQSNEGGPFQIFVQAFPGPGGKWQVTEAGGVQPRWRQDGRELFYIGLDGTLMSVAIRAGTNDRAFETGTPVALFSTRIADGPLPGNNSKHQYAVAIDGTRILMNVAVEEAPPIAFILNWDARMKR